MADNSGAEKTSSPPHGIVRNKRALWWTGGAVVLIALVVVTWLERKRISFSLPHQRLAFLSDWFLPLGLGAGALLALAILWKVPQWQVGHVNDLAPKERFDRVNEARKTLATILGGAAFLVGGFLTWQNLKVAQQNLEVSREGQITDRFSKAIEQLGAVDASGKKKLEVRLGGIYALEGIANESKELHWPIMEVLTAYVRENAPGKPVELTWEDWEDKASAEPPPLAADIQAILTVLRRRDTKYEREGQHLDLDDTDLRRAQLSGAYLYGAFLGGADLREADLDGTNLRRAILGLADLSGANLTSADLSEAMLNGAHLNGADLRWTRGLTQRQIDTAKGDSTTQLPENQSLHMPESWEKYPHVHIPESWKKALRHGAPE